MFGVEFWKIAAGLGVPGFALAIIAFLVDGVRKLFTENGPTVYVPAVMAYLAMVGGLSIFLVDRVFPTQPNTDYIFRITVVDPAGIPVQHPDLSSNLGGEPKGEFRSGHEYAISRAKARGSDEVTFTATYKGMIGHTTASFRNGTIPVEIQLAPVEEVTLAVNVLDDDGAGISGANVVVESTGQSGVTDDNGFVSIPLDVNPGDEVRIRVDKGGYETKRLSPFVGTAPVTVALKRKEES